ncbi:serine O-acetyltransferase [Adlercreutzia sp. ZJ141]|uniref:serine O-acetyltransferase n=1 Tax=Adlercreutzia sp. ZJ141 TaxID=2709406 RepID=UPI0013ED49B4|nr:hypothetical protein [Adlercreutzia sp. ZJ141]
MNISEDFKASAEGKGFSRTIGTFFFNPCWHSVALFRLSAMLYRLHLEPFAKVVWYLNRVMYCVDLDYRARLAPGFKLVHGLGVVVGADVVSDGPLTLYQGVTLGGSLGRVRDDSRGSVFTQPHFGKNCTVFTNACVFGPVYVGDNVIVKAARIVTKDIEAGARV